jgi:hypothetical protein
VEVRLVEGDSASCVSGRANGQKSEREERSSLSYRKKPFSEKMASASRLPG